jgi:hypothetical protein
MSLVHRLTLLFNFFAIVTSILTGCRGAIDPKTAGATAAAAATGQDYLVPIKDKVPLYVFGPQQLAAPDRLLNKDDLVRVVRTQLGFSLVQTLEGQVGWVASEDLAAAPAETLIGAGLAYEAPLSRSGRSTAQTRSVANKSNYPAERDTAIVKRYTIPDSDLAAEPTPSPSPSPTPGSSPSTPSPSPSVQP